MVKGQEVQPGFRSDWMEEVGNCALAVSLSLVAEFFVPTCLPVLSLAFLACVYPGSAMVFLTILKLFSTWDR